MMPISCARAGSCLSAATSDRGGVHQLLMPVPGDRPLRDRFRVDDGRTGTARCGRSERVEEQHQDDEAADNDAADESEQPADHSPAAVAAAGHHRSVFP